MKQMSWIFESRWLHITLYYKRNLAWNVTQIYANEEGTHECLHYVVAHDVPFELWLMKKYN